MPHASGCVTGRFQPLHLAHLELLLHVASRHEHLIVAITNPDPSDHQIDKANRTRHELDANPFTYYERQRFVRAAIAEAGLDTGRLTVVPFPLHRPERWLFYVPANALQYVRIYSPCEERKVELLRQHYDVEAIWPVSPKAIAATDIRAAIVNGGLWRPLVPVAVAGLIEPGPVDG